MMAGYEATRILSCVGALRRVPFRSELAQADWQLVYSGLYSIWGLGSNPRLVTFLVSIVPYPNMSTALL
jgi:hypothetical protein